jgi:hypothetical protein
MSSLQNEIDKLKTLQESYHELSSKVGGIPDLKNIYSARFEKNNDGENTYSMILPLVAGVIANDDGETVTIKL